ncbi:MAG TPA: hypothetical protein VE778_02340 [Candidatus Bathyarchaeia archaeon]|jgi:hypothetical protein|nr:hypothetical protein [Candidatus Bathyarchaeia archaeon]
MKIVFEVQPQDDRHWVIAAFKNQRDARVLADYLQKLWKKRIVADNGKGKDGEQT